MSTLDMVEATKTSSEKILLSCKAERDAAIAENTSLLTRIVELEERQAGIESTRVESGNTEVVEQLLEAQKEVSGGLSIIMNLILVRLSSPRLASPHPLKRP